MRFEQPYYVSTHAVQRFKKRVANLPTRVIRVIIQIALQHSGKQLVGYQVYNRRKCPVYKAQYRDKEYLIPVIAERKKANAWPVVLTILKPDMRIYTERVRKCKSRQQQV
ncbi:MAG: hypothetical protein RQM92_09500 [Candidatus Syntrophopropionicum ammoniitolerans]